VLRAATLEAATFLRVEQQYGTVAVGKRADLLILDANPLARITNTRGIRAVVLGGRPFERAALDSMLTAARTAAQRPLPASPGKF
jgi:imidazolonepropionase-like amidohydrolase